MELRPIKRERRDINDLFSMHDVDENGCWIWNGTTSTGYGIVKDGKKHVLAHRAVYAKTHGAIPDGVLIDHKCRVTLCVNPDHLQAATSKTNGENRNMSKANKSGVRGVCWDPRNRKWVVQVRHNYRPVWGGRHATLEAAEAAAIALRNSLFTNNLDDRVSELSTI